MNTIHSYFMEFIFKQISTVAGRMAWGSHATCRRPISYLCDSLRYAILFQPKSYGFASYSLTIICMQTDIMESDDRFRHLASDPRFKTLRRSQRKVQIDDRFKSMFTEEKFSLGYSKDKRGRNQKKAIGEELKKYYSLEENPVSNLNDESVDEEKDDRLSNVSESDSDDANGPGTIEDELSSSSDESESDDEITTHDQDIEVSRIKYDWQPLDHDAELAATTTRRLAIQNVDWDHIDVKDLFILVNSIRPPLNVRIYVSDFGKERLRQEEIEGPKEIVEMSSVDETEEELRDLKDKLIALKNPGPKVYRVNEYEDADEEMDLKNEQVRERVRMYQLNRMKYYYAIVEFDSVLSAEATYKELDGMEFEGSSLELDLRFVPDDIEFSQEDIKAECCSLPDPTKYKAPQFINSALQQTTVNFTWDETDNKRQEKLRRAYTQEELEKDDLAAYLASETESECKSDLDDDVNDAVSVVTTNSENRINKYKTLLKDLEEEEYKKNKVEVDVEWGNYSEDEARSPAEDELNESASISSVNSMREKKRGRNKREQRKGRTQPEEDQELDLLLMDSRDDLKEFEFDPDDKRFEAVYESGLYNIDPSHPNFKRTRAFDIMAERKREKRKKTV